MSERQDLITKIDSGYAELIQATARYRKSAMEYAKREHEINVQRSSLINSGAITGKNAEAREAEILTAMFAEYEQLFELGITRDRFYADKEIAEMSIANLRAKLRIYELSNGVFEDETN